MTNILVVDDSENDRLLIRRAFEKASGKFCIFEAEGALAALAYLLGPGNCTEHRPHPLPDLVICDIHLAGKSGFDFMDMIRCHCEFEDLKIALMSGTASGENRERALEKGACAFIDKGDLVKNPAPFFKAVEDCLSDASALRR